MIFLEKYPFIKFLCELENERNGNSTIFSTETDNFKDWINTAKDISNSRLKASFYVIGDKSYFKIANVLLGNEVLKILKHKRECKDGKNIYCPNCKFEIKVYHFSWSAICCPGCKTDVNKLDFLLNI